MSFTFFILNLGGFLGLFFFGEGVSILKFLKIIYVLIYLPIYTRYFY